MPENGIHHVTAIAGDPRRNLDFYRRTLGLRLVKKTVNFDDPGSYHLYYGDDAGRPGTILTFFPWEHAAAGRPGAGEIQETVFRIPRASLAYWMRRLPGERTERFGEERLSFQDPDGLRLALAAVPGTEAIRGWEGGDVPAEHAIRGFHAVSLMLENEAPTGAILSDVFGLAEAGKEGDVTRYRANGAAFGGIVDLQATKGMRRAGLGRGSVHHLAFRAADDAAQAAMVRRLAEAHGIATTDQKDRTYFRSVYFREPGGVLFEIATDQPGFAIDEAPDALGTALKLPPLLEARRQAIEAALPRLP